MYELMAFGNIRNVRGCFQDFLITLIRHFQTVVLICVCACGVCVCVCVCVCVVCGVYVCVMCVYV